MRYLQQILSFFTLSSLCFLLKSRSHNIGCNLNIPKPLFLISAHLVWDLFRDGKRAVDDELLAYSEDSSPQIFLMPNLLKSQA